MPQLILLWKYESLAVWTSEEKDESKDDRYSDSVMDLWICAIFSLLPSQTDVHKNIG